MAKETSRSNTGRMDFIPFLIDKIKNFKVVVTGDDFSYYALYLNKTLFS